MKKISSLLFVVSAFIFAGAQTNPVSQLTIVPQDLLQIKQAEYDFGKIPQGKPVYTYFEIVNTGGEPLKLDNVQASCGCTTPEWDHAPIAAGATAKIKVGYNAAGEGYFDKMITITYKGTSKQLKIKGTVWKAPEGSAPVNASIDLLKKQTF